MDTQAELPRLDEYSKDEWRSVVRKLKPDVTEEEYDRMWDEFLEHKQKRKLH